MKPAPTVWKYRLPDPLVWQTRIAPNFENLQSDLVFFTDEQGRLWLSIGLDGTITVEAGYAWDGCSPKWKWGWLLFGTPDGAPNPATAYPYTYFASCLHDAMLQWEDDTHMPYSRAEIDRIFLERLLVEGFPAAWLYYRAVRFYSRWVGFWRKVPSLRISL